MSTRKRCLVYLVAASAIAHLPPRRGCRPAAVFVGAQQSAAGQDVLIGVAGRDFVMMGADSNSAGGGGIALTSVGVDKIAVVHDGGGGGFGRRRGARSTDDSGGDADGTDPDQREELWRRESLEQQAIGVGFAGDFADADRLVNGLKMHAQVREYEAGIGNDVEYVFEGSQTPSGGEGTASLWGAPVSPAGLDAESVAYLARNEIASRLRSAQPLKLCLLVGGMVRCAGDSRAALSEGDRDGAVELYSSMSARVQKQVATVTSASYIKSGNGGVRSDDPSVGVFLPKKRCAVETINNHNPFLVPRLLWLDQYGSLQNLRYGAHGFGSNFCLSVLDEGYRPDLTRDEAEELIRDCFDQLRKRYVINSPKAPCIKCVDVDGMRLLVEKERTE